MRKSIFRSNKKFFHVSLEFRTRRLFKSLDWVFVQKKLADISRLYEVEVQALVMMDTHLHLLISTFGKNENFFCEELQKALCETAHLQNLSEPILNYSQYLNTYKYLFRNPVEAGLCAKVEDYPYSTLYYLLGKGFLHFSVQDQLGLIQNPLQILRWLNTDIDYKISQVKLLNQYKNVDSP
jgi:putative transposase